jgi:transposase
LKESRRQPLISREEIRAVYREGEDAVIALVEGLLAQIENLNAKIVSLEARIASLEEQQSKNSRNSSKPPSGDGFGKRTQSLRQKSQRSSGGQIDHPGQTLEWRDSVDEVISLAVEHCQSCGADLNGEPVEQVRTRQVHELPPIALQVTEYQAEVKTCPHCQHLNQAPFPVAVTRPVQYGSRLKGMLVYLMSYQLLPSDRTRELVHDLLGVNLSEGTLYNNLTECFEALEPFENLLHDRLRSATVAHFDETGLRVNQRLWWLHVACTDQLTAYSVQKKRGTDGMDAMGILPEFQGNAIHDGWKSYESYPCAHFLCNAHHLRELQFIWEHYQQPWAVQMSLLLRTMHHQVKDAKQQALTSLDAQQLQDFETRYHAILAQGVAENPVPLQPLDPDTPKSRGRPKQAVPKNLLDRLQSKQDAVLGFLYDFRIPFDNNQAERDIRMVKLKQKISGCFRTEDGAHSFARIRSFLATLKKQGISLLDSFALLFDGIAHPLDFFPE